MTVLYTDFFSAAETLSFLINVYRIRFSRRQLRRVLKNRGRKWKGQHSDMNGIVQAVEEELEGSGSIIAYQWNPDFSDPRFPEPPDISN